MAPVFASLVRLFTARTTVRAKTVVARLAAIRQARANRRAFAQLAGWDDHMLADIGLNHSTVAGALETGFADDPSAIVTRDSSPMPPVPVAASQPRATRPLPPGCWAY